ncbi:MAG: hypothetical protein IPH44_31780 [Myxococcales bacterium]|nr:hypothetical protein [Myxococcales bacterium]MBK7194247.1 hypothetical protein [Myxococcales bacterium]MBP6843332.1 hypothetical protein [Kofleriaceae bacterium]
MTDDDDRLDLDAWAAPPPPARVADRVLDAVSGRARATALDGPAAPRRRWAYAAVGGALVAAAVAAIALRPSAPPPDHGRIAATAPTTVRLGRDLEALAEPGAALSWTTVDGVAQVAHTAGVVTYRQRGSLGLVVETPVAALTSERATFRVEAPMNRTVAVGATSAAIAAVVVIAVYEGRVSAQQPDRPAQPIAAGAEVTLGAPPPVAPPPVVAVAKAAVDGARRQQVAAAIARARATPRVGGAPVAPIAPAAPAVADPSPGVLDKDEIRAGVKDVVPMLSECFEAELERDPSIGRVDATAHLTIDSAADIGTVVAMRDLDVDGPLGQSQDFHDCMTATLEAMVLPPMGDGGHVEVTYPFVFAQLDEPAPTATGTPAPGPTAPRKPTPVRPLKPVTPSDPAELADRAAEAAMNADYARAFAMAERGLAMAPTGAVRTKLLNTAAITACRLKNVVRARHYYALVSPATKPVLAQSCLRELGIDLAAE